MSKKYLFSEVSLLSLLIAVAMLCIFPLWDNSVWIMTIHSALLVVFAIFFVFFWRENSGDEREIAHQMFADRLAFFVGMTALLISIVWQYATIGAADRSLVIIVIIMVTAKIIGRMYGDRWC